MCRWLAYCGSPIFLDSLIFEPENSLVSQSRHALQSASATNADGFGVGWYGGRPEPGLFRDIQPAWNDENLKSLSSQICSPLFFAHIRASTGTSVSRSNCHPFNHENWMFMHNGMIGGYDRVRRDLTLLIAPELFSCIRGNTDSEIIFYLLLSNGLRHNPVAALVRTVRQVCDTMEAAAVDEAFTMTCAVSDGTLVYALRYASAGVAPSLFYGCGIRPHGAPCGGFDDAGDSVLILSEPLDHVPERWIAVPESHLLIAGGGGVAVSPVDISLSGAAAVTVLSA